MNNQQPLIKDMIPQEKKSVRKQKMLGPYDFYEVTSAFRKDIKLGNKESAIFWLTVFLEFGDKSAIDYVLRQCWIMLAEDMYNPQLSSYCASIISMKKQVYCRETDHLFVLVTEMCDSEKWWEINKGREMIKLWWKAQGDLKNKKYKKIPSYALDQHTWAGKKIINRGGQVDDRFSGTFIGQAKTQYLYQRDGKISNENKLDSNFLKFWKKCKELLGKNEK